MADLERSNAATAPARNAEVTPSDIESLPALFGRLADDTMKLLDTKLSLLKVEIKEDAGFYARGGALIGVGAIVAAVGFALLNIAVAFFVASLLPQTLAPPTRYALGFLLTGIVYLVIGGIIIVVMKNRLAKRDPTPNRSVEELRKDKQWLKNEI
jgi:uncharacterized membrane protein YqjE